MIAEFAWIMAGALFGGFVNGLTGFGTALAAMPFWLQAVPPTTAAQLAAAGGVIGQIQTLPKIRRVIFWRQVGPYIVPGLAGVPIGLAIAPTIGLQTFKYGVGLVLIVYSVVMLALPKRATPLSTSRLIPPVVGFAGGILGGLAGLSGVLPIIWASLAGMPRDERRALFQSFNLCILAAVLFGGVIAGHVGRDVLVALIVCLPATLLGAHLGSMFYRRLDDHRFDRLVLGLLFVSGVSLLVRG